jgi:heat shock protein HtpX
MLIFMLLALFIAFGWAVGNVIGLQFTHHAVQNEYAIPAALPDVEGTGVPVASHNFSPPASMFGIAIAIVVWVIMVGVAFSGGEDILLAQAGATEIGKSSDMDKLKASRIFNIVEEMQLASGAKTMPRVFIINSPVPNAFAVGRTPERACIAVSTGLLARLNRDELQGVIAHEMSHIVNRDTMFMTLAGVTVGALVLIADSMRYVRFSGYGDRRDSKDSGQLQTILLVVSILLIILAPILAQLLYFACSRRREYLADACGAQFTRYPEGLASALEKISAGQVDEEQHSRVLAPMYIVSPLAASGSSGSLLSTHPPTEERIKILRGMGRSASLAAYEESYKQQHGGSGVFKPGEASAFVQSDAGVPARDASAESSTFQAATAQREAKQVLQNAAGFDVINCACGLRMKLPPGFNAASVKCPRCGTVHQRN